MKRVFYLGYYDTPENIAENRNIVLAATNKMTYIVSAVEKTGATADIVSVSHTWGQKKCPAKTVDICERSKLHLFKTIAWSGKLTHPVSRAYTKAQALLYMLKNITKDDTLMVYHSLGYIGLVKLIKRIKKCRLVLEFEEVYGDVTGNTRIKRKELRFSRIADAYIFPSELLDEKVNTLSKPCTIIYGSYKVERDFKENFGDGKTHIVYAGTLDPRKGGSTAAVALSEKLDDNYVIHILGFGNDDWIKLLEDNLKSVQDTKKCEVTFEGLLSGDEYARFIQKCSIGLVTQDPTCAFNSTSFPSKILSYMGNGLEVVSADISAVRRSSLNEYVHFYENQTAQDIADAVKSVTRLSVEPRKIISELADKFEAEIGTIIQESR